MTRIVRIDRTTDCLGYSLTTDFTEEGAPVWSTDGPTKTGFDVAHLLASIHLAAMFLPGLPGWIGAEIFYGDQRILNHDGPFPSIARCLEALASDRIEHFNAEI